MSKFSIIMANHNRDQYIATAIDSVLNQTFKEWELIITDDASSDNSIAIIKEYMNSYPNIKLFQNTSNQGICYSHRNSINNIDTDLFGILDSDDALVNTAIEVMYQAHLEYFDYGLIYSQFMYCNDKLEPLKEGYCKAIPDGITNLEANVISHFKTFKLQYYNLTDGFHKTIKVAEDKDISFKMEEVAPVKFINQILYLYRRNCGGISQNNSVKQGKGYGKQVRREARERRNILI